MENSPSSPTVLCQAGATVLQIFSENWQRFSTNEGATPYSPQQLAWESALKYLYRTSSQKLKTHCQNILPKPSETRIAFPPISSILLFLASLTRNILIIIMLNIFLYSHFSEFLFYFLLVCSPLSYWIRTLLCVVKIPAVYQICNMCSLHLWVYSYRKILTF